MSKKNSSSGYRAPVEAADTLQSQQEVTIVEAVSEGPIVGLLDGAKSIALNSTPLMTESGAVTYQNVSWEMRTGTPDQEPFQGVDGVESERSTGNIEITHDYPKKSGSGSGHVTRTIENPAVTHVRITLAVAGLYHQIMNDPNRAGDTEATSISYRIVIRDGDDNIIADYQTTRTDKTTSQAQWTHKFALSGKPTWTITIYKITADSTESNLKNDLFWSSYTEIVGYPMIYPHTAVMLLKGNADTFGGSVPSRAYRVKGLMVSVPSNYDPEARTYTGIWDGTFKAAWTDNPAWILRDIVTSRRYGLGRFFPANYNSDDMIDKWSLYDIARLCDEMVPDGKGGVEPRYTFNQQITGQGEVKEVIQSIASCFHGMTYWSSGFIYAKSDYPKDAVRTLSPANVIDGVFTYSTGSAQERHSIADVTWYDPNDYGKARIERVVDWDMYRLYGARKIDVTAYGCYSQGQARRHGLWTLLTEAEQWQCTCRVGLDCYDLQPSDVVRISDEHWMGTRFAGRIKSISDRTVVLDAAVELTAGESYELTIVTSDLTEVTRAITNRGTTDTLVVDLTLNGVGIEENAVWSISGSDVAPRMFAVRSIAEQEDGTLELNLREVDVNKYARLEGSVTVEEAPGRKPTRGSLAAPTNLDVTESTYSVNNLPMQRLTFSWSATGDPEVSTYEPQYQTPAGAWQTFSPQKNCSVDVPTASKGQYLFRVRSVSLDGRTSAWAEKTHTAVGSQAKPQAPVNVQAKGGENSVTVSWEMSSDFLTGYYEVWVSEDDIFDHAHVAAKLYASSFVIMGLNASTPYWVWVRTVAITGTFSDLVGPIGSMTEAVKPPDIPDGTLAPSKLTPSLQQRIDSTERRVEALAGVVSLNAVDVFNNKVETDEGLAQVRQSITTELRPLEGAFADLQTDVVARFGEASAAIQENATAIAKVNGEAEAQYTLRTDVNGHVSGFGLWNDGKSSDFAIVASRFFVVGPSGVGPGVQVFTVDTESDAVVINGNLFVDSAGKAGNGWIKGNMIYAKSLIQLANGAIVLNGTNGTITVKDPAELTNGNFVQMASGYLRQYQGNVLTRMLSQVETGIGDNGATIRLTKNFRDFPVVSISPNSIQTYNANSYNQSQTLITSVSAVTKGSDGHYYFTPSIKLQTASGSQLATGTVNYIAIGE